MRCTMCGCEVGADYQQIGATRMCRNCSGHASEISKKILEKTIPGPNRCEECGKFDIYLFGTPQGMKCKSCKDSGNYTKTNFVSETPKDNINPSHYKQGKFETIEIIEDITKDGYDSYLVGNIIKYISRYKYKNGLEDLKKAQWYLDRLIKQKEPN